MLEIELRNVSKKIKGNTVLDNISLKMTSGRVYGLQGINGSGKTMLMRTVAGLIKTTTGDVIINGKILGKDITFPESMGLLIENPAFLDGYSGFDNLKILCSIKKLVSDADIRNIIETVGLNPDDRKKYKKYSLGMKQRLGIASAFMEKPELIILDEPTNALDSDGVEMIKNLIQEHRQRDALIILSCHDFSVLKLLSDEIISIECGKTRSIPEQAYRSDNNEK
ncbi:MAG: ATP-binding cassette domain-containing protein [Ruminococcus sp.]|nr:ATP-binding cassette domain-containing protein [Ruminococcus sp.]